MSATPDLIIGILSQSLQQEFPPELAPPPEKLAENADKTGLNVKRENFSPDRREH